jgi:type VII secretion ATPase EccA
VNAELIQEFRDGITDFRAEKYSAARNAFLWCVNIEPGSCDAIRAVAITENNAEGPSTADQITRMWETRDTYGKLLAACRLPATHLNVKRETGMWGVTTKLCTLNDIVLAYADTLIDGSRFDEAEEALRDANPNIPWTALTKTHLYYATRRWNDVLTASEGLSTARLHTHSDAVSDPLEPDYWAQSLSSLMAGEALCHLEQYRAGIERLAAALECPNEKVSGHAAYIAGLAYRSVGDEKSSTEMLALAVSRTPTSEVLHASGDPTVRLDITSAEMIEGRADKWNYLTEPSLLKERAQKAHDSRESLLELANAELADFIGLESVKHQVLLLQAKTEAAMARESKGMESASKNNHMQFVGPPGPGKTTIARVVGKIFAGLGIVAEDKFIESSRADFVGNTIGSTALKTKAMLEKAQGGVLFIDEAYALVYSGAGATDMFGKEALDVIVAEMENRRDDFVLIIAGYPSDIEKLLAVNDGLKSRFSKKIEFPSYTPEELWKIAEVTAKKRGSILGEGTREMLIDKVRTDMMTKENGKLIIDLAGNGRFIRQAIESAEDNRDLRLLEECRDLRIKMTELTPATLVTITAEDLKKAVDVIANNHLGISGEQG